MGTETLLHLGDGLGQRANFQFDHAMSHRTIWGHMAPLTGYSALPYFLDPLNNIPPWHREHQQAHDDFLSALPAAYGWEIFAMQAPQPNLIDTNLDKPEQRTWWLFVNHQAHYVAETTLSGTSTYQFW